MQFYILNLKICISNFNLDFDYYFNYKAKYSNKYADVMEW